MLSTPLASPCLPALLILLCLLALFKPTLLAVVLLTSNSSWLVRGLREWFSRGPGHGQSNNLDVSSFLHAPFPTSSSVITPPPTPTEAAQNVPNAGSLIGAGSLPTSVTLASMASAGPTVSAAFFIHTQYNNDAFVLHPVAFAHGSGLYATQDSSRSTAAYPVPHPSQPAYPIAGPSQIRVTNGPVSPFGSSCDLTALLTSTDPLQDILLFTVVDIATSNLDAGRTLVAAHIASGSKVASSSEKYLRRLRRGKKLTEQTSHDRDEKERELESLRSDWPRMVPLGRKRMLLEAFNLAISKDELSIRPDYISPDEPPESPDVERGEDIMDVDLDLSANDGATQTTQTGEPEYEPDVCDGSWLDSDCVPPPMPFDNDGDEFGGYLSGALVDPEGIESGESGEPVLATCKNCYSFLKRGKVPRLALSNYNFLGPVPEELSNLTVIEEAMIARCRAKCWIIQLKEEETILLRLRNVVFVVM
ncbi:hypothetical protein B0H11DRAFT_2391954 [Mycena galericulata]|nr:hypothetical protein B0H11DRAFT_2391954 [Mycena galericulata]